MCGDVERSLVVEAGSTSARARPDSVEVAVVLEVVAVVATLVEVDHVGVVAEGVVVGVVDPLEVLFLEDAAREADLVAVTGELSVLDVVVDDPLVAAAVPDL